MTNNQPIKEKKTTQQVIHKDTLLRLDKYKMTGQTWDIAINNVLNKVNELEQEILKFKEKS